MRLPLAVLFLFATSHAAGGGGGGCDCGHMGSGAHAGGGHAGNVSHGSISSGRMTGSAPSFRVAGAVTVPTGHSPHHPTFLHELSVGVRHVFTAGAQVLGAALGLEPDSDEPPTAIPLEPTCSSVEDCGDGQLGQGAVCDRWTGAPRNLGTCREACRDDADCPAPLRCRQGLDPDGPSWGGCIE